MGCHDGLDVWIGIGCRQDLSRTGVKRGVHADILSATYSIVFELPGI
jgi:hypothetical protein